MAMDIDLVFERIAAAVNDAQIPGLTKKVVATAFSPDSPTPPHFFLAEFVGEYDQTFDSDMNLTITARLMLSRAGEETGQQEGRILAGVGANTIRAALEAAAGTPGQSALSGACDDIQLRRVTGPRLYDYGEAHFYGLEFTIFVLG
jgi:hypothetical protein